MVSVRAALHQATRNMAEEMERVLYVSQDRACVFVVCMHVHVAMDAASSGVSSCAERGGRIGKRNVSRQRTGRVWRPCASGSDASAHQSVRNASHSCPTCTCTASHLQSGRERRV